MKFFIPHVKPADLEATYADLVAAIKDQMRWVIAERRIYRLEYIHDKRRKVLQVGELEATGRNYEVCAIMESNSYIVMTRDLQGKPGVTIMVNKDEVVAEEDFQVEAAKSA